MKRDYVAVSRLARYAADPNRFAREQSQGSRHNAEAKAFGTTQHNALMKLPLSKLALASAFIISLITAATVLASGGGS